MALIWQRPENVPFPSVWNRFEGRKPINGKIPKFWIQDIPEDMFEMAAEAMCKNFIYDEPLCKYTNLVEDKVSVEEMRSLWRTLVNQKMGLICFMENPDGEKVIAGLNMTYIAVKEDVIPKYEGKKWQVVLETVLHVCGVKDSYEMLGIKEYMNAMGLSVFPEFRGQGIGEALLNARTPLCKAVGIKATLTVFTAITSQTLAVRTGFKDIVNIPYDDLEKENPKFSFPGITVQNKNIRYMYKLV